MTLKDLGSNLKKLWEMKYSILVITAITSILCLFGTTVIDKDISLGFIVTIVLFVLFIIIDSVSSILKNKKLNE
jgi:amino acid permease